MLKRGTKSILFGVHQFLWHPFTVWRAWRYLYKSNPSFYGLICIFCHDLGYWGKPDMDGPLGQTHPEGGAKLARWLVYWAARLRGEGHEGAGYISKRARNHCLFHSTHYAQLKNASVSPLFLPDKVCVLFDPSWFYKLRARISGELGEYTDNDNRKRELLGQSILTPSQWLDGYRARIRSKAQDYFHSPTSPTYCECDICADKER